MHKQHKREQAPIQMRRRSLTSAIAITLAFGIAGPTFAQEAAQAAPAQAAGPAADQEAAPQELETITVTANKREENIREVAVAITKLTDQQLENINATQMTDYANYVPGLSIQSQGSPGQTQVSMRGIAAMSPSSTVGTYVDETPVGSNSLYQQATLYTLDLLPYDVGSIEVLRGPQGTLYGAGAMGGLIKYTMKKPDPTQSEYRMGFGFSSTDDSDDWGNSYRVGVNIPLKQDSLALRASYAGNNIAGYVDNLFDDREDINEGEQTSARAALLWQGESVDVQFTAMRQEIDSDNNATIALEPGSFARIDGLSNYVGVDEKFVKDIDNYALTVNWDAGFADFVSATSYSDSNTRTVSDLTFSYGEFPLLLAVLGIDPRLEAGKASLDYSLDLQQFTQEFRLQSKSGQPFEWLLGAFYSDEDGANHQLIPVTQMDGSPLIAPWNDLIGTLGELSVPSTYKETAVFANGSYAFTDRFKLGAGVRWSKNDQDFTQTVTYGEFIDLPLGTSTNSSSEDVVTWSITPQFQVNDDTMVYFKASTGYQPGGPNVVAPGLPPTVDSSTLTSYELGLKSEWFENRVLFDLVGYQIDWQDIQTSNEVNGVSGLVNGGEATSQGVEASLLLRPAAGLTFGLNAAWNDTEVDEDFAPIVVHDFIEGLGPITAVVNTGLAGDRMPYVPELTWAFTADYYVPLTKGWSANFGGGLRFVDDRTNGTTQRTVISLDDPPMVLQETIDEPLVIDAYNVLDVYASFSNEHWTLRTYVKNATDEHAYSTMNAVDGLVTGPHHISARPIQPRMFGFEVDYRF